MFKTKTNEWSASFLLVYCKCGRSDREKSCLWFRWEKCYQRKYGHKFSNTINSIFSHSHCQLSLELQTTTGFCQNIETSLDHRNLAATERVVLAQHFLASFFFINIFFFISGFGVWTRRPHQISVFPEQKQFDAIGKKKVLVMCVWPGLALFPFLFSCDSRASTLQEMTAFFASVFFPCHKKHKIMANNEVNYKRYFQLDIRNLVQMCRVYNTMM